MYGFSTNVTCLKGVNKQDWNSAYKSQLATKNTGRWFCLPVHKMKNKGIE